MNTPQIVGILNITPDSFSDGGKYLKATQAIEHARSLVDAGADLIDIGADSTRPGSSCIGSKLEIERLKPILENWPQDISFSVDTHNVATAAYALKMGAVMINDVMAGFDSEMFSLIAQSSSKYVMMYSRAGVPHDYSDEPQGDIFDNISIFFEERLTQAQRAGVALDQIILDPGMGKFISDNPENSWQVIRNFEQLLSFGTALYFGSSRKGFLKLPLEKEVIERDLLSGYTGKVVAEAVNDQTALYLRVHSPATQRAFLKSSCDFSHSR